jgi:ATP-binding cassette subfamily B (MDR/TAP) protein 1
MSEDAPRLHDDTIANTETLPIRKMTWKSLFAFMRKEDNASLIPALILTAVCGAAKPTPPIFIGKVFEQMGDFQSGTVTSTQLLHTAKTWALALTFLGLGLAVCGATFFSLWILFSESQARSVRVRLFNGMLNKQISWFDLRSDGIGSLLVRIHT